MISLNIASPPEHVPDRYAINFLLLTTVAVLGLHVARLPLWLSLVSLCLIGWRYLVDNHGWRLPGKILKTVIAFALMIAVIKQYGGIIGRDAGVALLVGLAGLKLLEMRRLRDFTIAILALYFLTLGAFLFSQSILVGVYALAVAFLATVTLMLLSQAERLALRDSFKVIGKLFLQSAPLVLILYLLFPRIQGLMWGVPDPTPQNTIGLTDTVTPGSIHSLAGVDKVAFRVEFDDAVPKPRDLYWRAMVLKKTDGRSWTRGRARLIPGPFFIDLADNPEVRYTITLEANNKPWMVALETPISVPPNAIGYDGFYFQADKPIKKRKRYSLSSVLNHRAFALGPEERALSLQQPGSPSRRMRELIAQWQSRAPDNAGIVRQALGFFREQEFVYTLTPPLLGPDPVDEFLFETRRGYCEHYASAFVTLMRAANIPSRMVIGYQGGEFNDSGDYMIVRQSDAHAWAEVWLAEQGWQRVDPTAAVAPERIELGFEALRRLDQLGQPFGELTPDVLKNLLAQGIVQRSWHRGQLLWDSVNTHWDRWVMAYGPQRQLEFMRWLGFRTPSWTQMVASLAAGMVLLLLILAAINLRPRHRPDPLVAVYTRFCTKLGRMGLVRRPTEGPADYSRRVALARPDLSMEVRTITQLYIKLRYGKDSLSRTLALLRRRVRAFRPQSV